MCKKNDDIDEELEEILRDPRVIEALNKALELSEEQMRDPEYVKAMEETAKAKLTALFSDPVTMKKFYEDIDELLDELEQNQEVDDD